MTRQIGSQQTGAIDVSIAVVAFNSQDCIAECISAIGDGARDAVVEVLLIDNGGGETADLVARDFPHVRIIPGEGNIGFARANNRLAKQASGEFLLLLNPDAFLKEGAIDALVEATTRYPDAGAWGGVTLDGNGIPDFGNAIPEPSLGDLLSGVIGRAKAGKAVPTEVVRDQQADILSGGFMMVRRTVWERFGGLDPRFFLYCEEVDLCVRLRRSGLPLYRIAKAQAEHRVAHGNYQSPRRRLYQSAGLSEYFRKHWPMPKRLIGRLLIWLAALQRAIIGTLFGKRGTPLAATGEAYRLVAWRPALWWRGYHPSKGLKARLDRGELRND